VTEEDDEDKGLPTVSFLNNSEEDILLSLLTITFIIWQLYL